VIFIGISSCGVPFCPTDSSLSRNSVSTFISESVSRSDILIRLLVDHLGEGLGKWPVLFSLILLDPEKSLRKWTSELFLYPCGIFDSNCGKVSRRGLSNSIVLHSSRIVHLISIIFKIYDGFTLVSYD
jgi:hypothetical protein